MAFNPSSFITRNPLEAFSIRLAADAKDYIAAEVFTPVIVGKEAFKVYQYDTNNLRHLSTLKASGAEAALADYGVFTTDKTAKLHKLAGEYDPADAKNFDVPVASLQQDTAATLMDLLLIDREVEAATLATTATNYPAGLTSTLTTTWLEAAGDPEGNAATARAAVKASCGRAPNAAAMSWTSFQKLRGSPYLVDRMKYTNAAVNEDAFKEMLKSWLGVQHLHICGALKNTSIEGNATQTLADVWDDSLLMYVKDTTGGLRTMAYGKSYIFNQLYTHEYQVNERGSGAGRIQRLELGWSYVLAAGAVVSASDSDFSAGYLLKNIV